MTNKAKRMDYATFRNKYTRCMNTIDGYRNQEEKEKYIWKRNVKMERIDEQGRDEEKDKGIHQKNSISHT